MDWTIGKLLAARVRMFWLEQIRVWRTALDWTVWLYFIVPAVWIGGGTYADWWAEPPAWLTSLPPWFAALPPLVLVLTGRLRVFVEEADMLFLLQRRPWISGMIAGGALYTLLVQAARTAVLFGIMLVWLVRVLALDAADIAAWAAMTLAGTALLGAVAHLIGGRWRGWRKLALLAAAGTATGVAYLTAALQLREQPALQLLCAAAALVGWLAAIRAKLRAQGTFDYDVRRERAARLASTQLLLMQVTERPKPALQLERPLLFRRSGRIFRSSDAGTMLGEMRMKSFMRKFANMRLLLGFASVSSTAVLLSPGWLALLLPALLAVPGAMWLHRHWHDWIEEPFVAQFRWEEQDARKGASLSRFWLLLPIFGWLGLLAGWVSAGAAGIVLGAPAGALYWWALNKLLEEWLSPLPKRKARA